MGVQLFLVLKIIENNKIIQPVLIVIDLNGHFWLEKDKNISKVIILKVLQKKYPIATSHACWISWATDVCKPTLKIIKCCIHMLLLALENSRYYY